MEKQEDEIRNEESTLELSAKMYTALNGRSEPRTKKVTGRWILTESERERRHNSFIKATETDTITQWNKSFNVDIYGCLNTEIEFSAWNKHKQGMLEAFLLIPEEAGLITVDRVAGDYGQHKGFLHPQYDETVIEAIYHSASRYFENCSNIFTMIDVIRTVQCLTPKEILRFRKEHNERILNGIANVKFKEQDQNEEDIWSSLCFTLKHSGFTGKDDDFVKAVWKKSKTLLCGYLSKGGGGAAEIIAEALMDRDPNGVMNFKYIRDRIPYSNLSEILAKIPVRVDNVKTKDWQLRHNYPKEDIYVPIVEFVDRILSK